MTTLREEALDFTCPTCGAKPQWSCTYQWPAGIAPNGRSDTAEAARQRFGKPTRIPHNKRMMLASNRRAEHLRRERHKRRLNTAVLYPISRDARELQEAAKAINRAALTERELLRRWLYVYGSVLTEANRTNTSEDWDEAAYWERFEQRQNERR